MLSRDGGVWGKGIAKTEEALLAVHQQVRGIVVPNRGDR